MNPDGGDMDDKKRFTASRLTAGNLLFPVWIEVTRERVLRVRPTLLGSSEESIAIPSVASVTIESGMIWSEIRIDSTGGTNPIRSGGHPKADAHAMRDLIEKFQQAALKLA